MKLKGFNHSSECLFASVDVPDISHVEPALQVLAVLAFVAERHLGLVTCEQKHLAWKREGEVPRWSIRHGNVESHVASLER